MRLPEPGKPGHKLRGSWPSPPPRCRGPPSLRWRPRRSTFAPGRGQTPLATPRPYSTPGSPSPRPLPAGPAQPLAPRRPALLLGPEPSKCPELAPRPHAQASPAGPGFPLPPRPAPESTSYFATQLGPIRVRPAPRPSESPVRSGVRPPTPPLPGCRPGPLPAPAEPTQARGPGPGPGAGLGPGGVAASRHEGWVHARSEPARGGGRGKQVSLSSLRPRRRAAPSPPSPLPRSPLHLGRAPRPLSQLCSSPRCRGSGRSGRRREVEGGAGIRPLGSGRTRGGGGEGGGGRGGRPAVLGAPPASPGEAGTSPGSRRPRTGHGGRTEPPSPASPWLQEGGGASNAAWGRRASVFARALCVALSFSV